MKIFAEPEINILTLTVNDRILTVSEPDYETELDPA